MRDLILGALAILAVVVACRRLLGVVQSPTRVPERYRRLTGYERYCADCELRTVVTVHGRCPRCDGDTHEFAAMEVTA